MSSTMRWFVVLAAALLPLLAGQQVPATTTQHLGAKGDIFNVRGLRAAEVGENGPFRWTDQRISIDLQPLGWPHYTSLDVQGVRPEGEPLARVGAEAYGRDLGTKELPRTPSTLEYRLPAASLLSVNPRLELTTTVFQPAGDNRTLGIVVYRLHQRSGPFPSVPAPWPALPLALSVALVYLSLVRALKVAGRAGSYRLPLVAALCWGLAIGVLNALNRPWLVFYSWYWLVPPLLLLLILPWAQTLRRGGPSLQGSETPKEVPPLYLPAARSIAFAVAGASVALMAWHFLAPAEPPGNDPRHNISWGVSFYTALPLPVQLGGLALFLGALAWAWLARDGAWEPPPPLLRLLPAVPFLGMLLFALLPVAYSEGDSHEFDVKIQKGAIWRERELIDFYLKVRLWRLLEPVLRLPSHAYQLVAVVAGGIYLAGVGLLGRTLGRSRADALVIAGALVATGNILIFFRYVESYALVTAASLFVIWACWRYTEGKLSFGAVGALSVLAFLIHGSALWWGPMVVSALIFGSFRRPRAERLSRVLSDLRDGICVGLAILLLVASVMLIDAYDFERLQAGLEEMGGGDGRTLLPLFTVETRFEHYPFFSWSHLGAVIQEQMLTAPMALVSVLIVAGLAWRGVRAVAARRLGLNTLAVGAAGMFLYSITWNPDLGPRNDWDLMALPALPLTLLAIYLLLQLPPGRYRRLALTSYLALSAVHAAAWVLLHLLNIRY